MIEFLQALPEYREAFYWLLFAAIAWSFYRFVNSENNALEWYHFISSRNNSDGRYYADLDKLGKATGILGGTWAVITVSANAKSDFTGFAAILAAYFAFVGGIAGYSAYLRSKSGQVVTTTTTEPAPKTPLKVTVTESAPALPADQPTPVKIVDGAGVSKPLKVEQSKRRHHGKQ